ncbi:MAG TPA: glycosyltransferase family 87 protein [Anaerolineaceae bacterium]|nr:glycosyltransferase family 87 protein [Anaerolineaceae bacterium]
MKKKPWLAGLGLCLGAITKVTPLIFMGYLFINRRFRALIWSVVWMIAVCLFTGLVYGFDLYSSFLDQFFYLLTYIGTDLNNQGLLAKLQTLGMISSEMVPTLKTLLTGYYTLVILVTAGAAWIARVCISTFVTLLLVMVLAPNMIWYHHYVFLLPAVILLVSQRQKSIWGYTLAAAFLLILQVDRYRLTSGLLIQACSHITLLGLWVSLLVKAIQVIKSTRVPSSLLPKISQP